MAEQSFDVVVIGSGPGGYVCAIKAAQLGLKTACVEKRGTLGGTCLNVGCIPSKALLQSSHLYAMAGHELAQHGVKAGKVELDFGTLMGRKDKVVADFTKGIEFLFRKNKVTWLKGLGRLIGNGKVEILNDGKGETISAKHIIIATGSDVTPLTWRGDRREADRDLDRRAGAGEGAGASDRDRRRRDRAGAGLGLAAPRRQGDGGRVPRPHRRHHGCRDRRCLPEDPPEAGHRIQARHQGDSGEEGRRQGDVEPGARQGRRGGGIDRRRGAGLDRPAAVCRRPGAGIRRREAGRQGPHRGRRSFPDQRARHLRHRRRDPRPDAGAQGGGGGRRAGRDAGGPGRPRELRDLPQHRLHLAGAGQRRQDRGRAEGRRHLIQGRQVSRSSPTPAPRPTPTPTAW